MTADGQIIPEDIMARAYDIRMDMCMSDDQQLTIAKALHAERERCAVIAGYYAQACLETESDGSGYYACSALVDEIRNPNSPKQPSRPTHDEDLPF
jgi:hypothetical protein